MSRLAERFTLTSGRPLPRSLAPLSKLIRGLAVGPLFTYWADGIAIAHYCPFIEDAAFETANREMAENLDPGVDMRWRMWLLCALAQQSQHLPGNFAEFGAWRGGCAYMILSRTDASPGRRFFLFDTFVGIPGDRLTAGERRQEFEGQRSDTSVEHVDRVLARWRGQYEICAGDIFDTLGGVDVGPLAFAHIDMNAVAPSKLALEFVYSSMVPGGTIVFDDYGWPCLVEQRLMIDEFFADVPETVIALPTGQAFAVKH